MSDDYSYPHARVTKKMSIPQSRAFFEALYKAGIDQPTALEQMFQQFVESQGIEWPERQPRGGNRQGAGRKPRP